MGLVAGARFSQTNLRLGLLTKIEAAQTIGFPAGGIPGSRGAGERGARGGDILIGAPNGGGGAIRVLE